MRHLNPLTKCLSVIPKWNDDDAVAAWVGKVIDDARLEEERQFYTLPWDTDPGMTASEGFAAIERDAIAAAEGGNFRLLAEILDGSNPVIRWMRSKGCHLGPRSEALIAGYLKGQRGRRGRPKETVDERRSGTPVHDAAAEFKEIQEILSENYPREKGRRDRAITIAADRAKIRHDTLANYLKSRRRLP
jgi:hypothetical protein